MPIDQDPDEFEPASGNPEGPNEAQIIAAVIFGISIPVGLFIAVYWGSQIESSREGTTLFRNILLWALEWAVILIGLCIPWLAWKYFKKTRD